MKNILELLEKLESGDLNEADEARLFEALAEVNEEYEQILVDPKVRSVMDRVAKSLQEPEK